MSTWIDAAQRMDRMYRHQRFFYDATRKPYLLGRDAMLRGLAPPQGGTILEIGCGTGRNLIAAAQKYPDTRLYGFDVSAMMLDTAQKSIARAGLASRITLAEADATAFDPVLLFGRRHFDRVYVSFVLSMIPEWAAVVARATTALDDGGSLHVVDFGQQEHLPRWFATTLRAWLRLFHVTPRDGLTAELKAHADRGSLRFEARSLCRGYSDLTVMAREPTRNDLTY
jgi:S-adenosylmethionine-diacylgycerolhomoserine-N-methlytransferase